VTDFRRLLATLVDGAVEFLVVGGLAANVHGSGRLTSDVDVVYARTPANLHRLSRSLTPLHPYLRGAPPGLPFLLDERTLAAGLNFTLTTDAGDLDLLVEISGGGGYGALLPHSVTIELFGHAVRCLDLPTLIQVKRAAGRAKDLEVLAELEVLLDESAPDSTP
jgi:predicted nucleotidyltransferase